MQFLRFTSADDGSELLINAASLDAVVRVNDTQSSLRVGQGHFDVTGNVDTIRDNLDACFGSAFDLTADVDDE